MNTATRYALFGQLGLIVFLLICVLLKPKFLLETNEGGISNYGLYTKTAIPYVLAFIAAGAGTILAALSLPNRPVRIALVVLGTLFFAVLVSTYRYNTSHILKDIHELLSSALILAELGVGTWLGIWLAPGKLTLAGLIVQYAGVIAAILNFLVIEHILFIAECVASIGFSIVFVGAMERMDHHQKS